MHAKPTNHNPSSRFWIGVLLVLVSIGARENLASQPPEKAWQALQKGEAVALIRHAKAPGTGDPPGFSIGDCSTQRNLSEEGRDQARRIGDFFRSHGVRSATVVSSRWCRCLETARLLGIGSVTELPALNSFFQEPAKRQERTTRLRDFLTAFTRKAPLVLVTHQVNITALTGVFPSSGEVVIYRLDNDGQGQVLGRFTP
jgi:broad specificity phosphatase PhoE